MNAARSCAIAAAVCAAQGTWAQGNVTLSGVVDLHIAHMRAGPLSSTRLEDGGNAASRLVFRGTEDLGGGLQARFLMESGFAPDTGNGTLPGPTMNFARQSFVGLSGPWGQLDLGRMYTPMFNTVFRADPLGVNALYSPLNLLAATDAQAGITPFAARASNMVRYRTPASSAFFADIAVAPGEASTLDSRSGRLQGGSVGWASKPFYVAYAFQRVKSGSAAAPVARPSTSTHQALSASYEFAPATVYANYATSHSSLPHIRRSQLVSLGGQYRVTPTSLVIVEAAHRKVSESERSQLAWTLGYDHHLSKRTVLYARWLWLNNRGGASATLAGAPIAPNSGHDVRVLASGIRHNF